MAYFTKYVCFYKLSNENTLMLNTLTGAIDVVDNETFYLINKTIKSRKINKKFDDQTYIKLKNRGYIFETKNEELKIKNKLREISLSSNSKVLNTKFVICPTMGCNLRCTYCFEGNDMHKNFKLMSEKQLNVIFNHIHQSIDKFKASDQSKSKLNYPTISLFGGEPLLSCNYSIIEKIFRFSNELKIPVSIVTNGTTINEYFDLIEKFKDIISVIQITLDGNKAIHDIRRIYADGRGTFDKICNGIDKILKTGIKISLRINVDKENIDGIPELKNIFDKNNWSKNPLFVPYASPVKCYKCIQDSNILKESEMLDIFIKNGWYGNEQSFLKTVLSPVFGVVTNFFETSNDKIKPWKQTYCEATFGAQYCFSPDGTITTCLTCVGKPKYKIGTFDENSVNIDENKLKMWTQRDYFNMQKCKECKFLLFCAGGCPVQSVERFGRIDYPSCDDIEKTIEIYVKNIANKLLLSKWR